MSKRAALYLRNELYLQALVDLCVDLGVEGQRGPGHNPLINALAEWYIADPEAVVYHMREAKVLVHLL